MLLIVAAVLVVVLAIAAVLSHVHPYGILRESWRQTIMAARPQWRLFLWALLAFVIMTAAHPLLLRFARPDFRLVTIAHVVIQGVVVYFLAHIAYRIHRGLIHSEWKPGLTFGRRERRMALYVLFVWAVTTTIAHLPIPAPPVIPKEVVPFIGLALWIIAFAVKALLAVAGPAASLDDPAPLRRSIATLRKEPVGALTVVVAVALILQLAEQTFRLVAGLLAGHAKLQWASAASLVGVFTFMFIFAEFALVIVLTRSWEDLYEAETRYAPHNTDWL
jgi:hypothetical protein